MGTIAQRMLAPFLIVHLLLRCGNEAMSTGEWSALMSKRVGKLFISLFQKKKLDLVASLPITTWIEKKKIFSDYFNN